MAKTLGGVLGLERVGAALEVEPLVVLVGQLLHRARGAAGEEALEALLAGVVAPLW